jgi:lysozyme family protein
MVTMTKNVALKKGLTFVKKWEGGFISHRNDPGGATNFGISLRFLRTLNPEIGDIDRDGDIDIDDVKKLTLAHAMAIYEQEFWNKYNLDTLDLIFAIGLFDTMVNVGPKQAILLAQRAINEFTDQPIIEDGMIGPQTIGVAAQLAPFMSEICPVFLFKRLSFYSLIASNKPKLEVFLRGWINRVCDLEGYLRYCDIRVP